MRSIAEPQRAAESAAETLPPLEFREPPSHKPSQLKGLLGGIAGAVVGGGITLGLIRLLHGRVSRPAVAHSALGSLASALEGLGLIAIAWIVTVTIHELGHAVVGALVGLDLERITIGPLRLSRTSNGWRPGITRGAQRFTGSVVVRATCWPGARQMRRAWHRMVWAGPAMNLALAAILLAMLLLSPSAPGGIASNTPRFTAAITILLCIAVALMSLTPTKAWVGGASDGEQLRRLRQPAEGGDRGEVFAAVVLLGAQASTMRPRDWNADALATAARPTNDIPTTASALNILYFHALDAGDLHRAHSLLQRLLDLGATTRSTGLFGAGFTKLYTRGRGDLAALAATFEAAWREDAAAASQWLARATPISRGVASEYLHHLASASVAWCRGDLAERDEKLAKMRELIATAELPAIERICASTVARISA